MMKTFRMGGGAGGRISGVKYRKTRRGGTGDDDEWKIRHGEREGRIWV